MLQDEVKHLPKDLSWVIECTRIARLWWMPVRIEDSNSRRWYEAVLRTLASNSVSAADYTYARVETDEEPTPCFKHRSPKSGSGSRSPRLKQSRLKIRGEWRRFFASEGASVNNWRFGRVVAREPRIIATWVLVPLLNTFYDFFWSLNLTIDAYYEVVNIQKCSCLTQLIHMRHWFLRKITNGASPRGTYLRAWIIDLAG